ncbi:unnamed protein product [Brachionus calyciflorus]|uniref:GOLD domain-containing protein n=1 Tax=Brachionus calyciflorus TaxID=104777 RepID=A0A813VUH5_9BILA|nr:unnamed protein product [Brachionus calyciflorus]
MLFLILVSSLTINYINCLQAELAIVVEPGQRECFHQYLITGLSMETDYQVISGGELDISYWITTPSNRILYTDAKKQGGQFQFKSDETGEYRFCFDNSFSRFAKKQVFFYLSSNDDFVDPHFPQSAVDTLNPPIKDQLGDLAEKTQHFQELFTRVNTNLERAQHVQKIFQVYELADRSHLEDLFERVNFWSVVNILVMILVGGIQVYMIRSLFEDKSKIGRVLRGEKDEPKSRLGL